MRPVVFWLVNSLHFSTESLIPMKENGGGDLLYVQPYCYNPNLKKKKTSAQGHLTFWQRPERKESVLFKTSDVFFGGVGEQYDTRFNHCK